MRASRFGPAQYLAAVLGIAAVVNFVWFMADSVAQRGADPTEFQRAHQISIFITHPLGLLGIAYLVIGLMFPRFAWRAGPGPIVAGPPLAQARCAGKIGWLPFGGPALKVAVYADRFTVRAFPFGQATVLGSDIRAQRPAARLDGGGLEITHSTAGVRSPLTLSLAAGHPVRQAIERLAPGAPPADRPVPGAPPADSPAPVTSSGRWPLVMSVPGLILSLGFAGFGVVGLMAGNGPFAVGLILVGLVSAAQCVREIVLRLR